MFCQRCKVPVAPEYSLSHVSQCGTDASRLPFDQVRTFVLWQRQMDCLHITMTLFLVRADEAEL